MISYYAVGLFAAFISLVWLFFIKVAQSINPLRC